LFEITQKESDEKGWDVVPVKTSTFKAVIALLGLSILIAICGDTGEYIIDSIDEVVKTLHINKTFISLILFPFSEMLQNTSLQSMPLTRVRWTSRLKSRLAAVFRSHCLSYRRWSSSDGIIKQQMNLAFGPFGAVVFFLSVIVVQGLVADEKSNYLEGAMLVGM
jgi:Ca2+/H+ antiporter